MNNNDPQKTKKDEAVFSAVFVILLLIIIPMLPLGKYGGGLAMLAVSIIGLIAYYVMFAERLRGRGGLKASIIVAAASFVLSAAVALTLTLTRGHWH